jgi:nucleoside 2-deoxyribosyltransferase
MRGYQILSTLERIDEGEQVQKLLGVTDTAITQRDRDDIRRSDVLLIFSGDRATWGTAFEWEMAFNLGKPIVVIAAKDNPTRKHPWCRTMCSYFAETIEEAVDFIDRWLDRGYQLDDEVQ